MANSLGAAAPQLITVGAGLIAIAALSNRVPATHGGLGLATIFGRIGQLGIGHAASFGGPCGEISGGGGGGGGGHGAFRCGTLIL